MGASLYNGAPDLQERPGKPPPLPAIPKVGLLKIKIVKENECAFFWGWGVLDVEDLFPLSGKDLLQEYFRLLGSAFGGLVPGIWWTNMAWWGTRDRLGLWDAAFSAHLHKDGHCYTFQPH